MTLDTSALDAKIKEAVKVSLTNTEALCAVFIQQNHDFPITDIQLCQKMNGTQTTWWIEPRAEDRVLVTENKTLKHQVSQLQDRTRELGMFLALHPDTDIEETHQLVRAALRIALRCCPDQIQKEFKRMQKRSTR